ncbi:unnamed protein product [Larinioides sclopetarius]|uniref:Uncharacterized protein n=2 Tax=Larinioides sclopetarius TaxID=280406 RepID=A0AAV2A0Z2_9ARAC
MLQFLLSNTTRRESLSELDLDPYSQSKGCERPIMHTPRSQEILYFKLLPKKQVLDDEDCVTDESFPRYRKHVYRWTSNFFNFKSRLIWTLCLDL